jgi:hypothetical protein
LQPSPPLRKKQDDKLAAAKPAPQPAPVGSMSAFGHAFCAFRSDTPCGAPTRLAEIDQVKYAFFAGIDLVNTHQVELHVYSGSVGLLPVKVVGARRSAAAA